MLISHSKRFVFVHIYRTGGTSVTQALIRHARMREQLTVRTRPTRALVNAVNALLGLYDDGNRWLTGAHKHASARELRTFLGREVYERYFSFAFVRNPWDWQLSVYHYVRAWKNHRDHHLARRCTLAEFITRQIERGAPNQLDFLVNDDGEIIVDRIGRFESLESDFHEILEELGLPATPLERLNSSGRRAAYRSVYDAESAELVRAHFARDIESFGFQFS